MIARTYDPDPKKSALKKVKEAIKAFQLLYGHAPRFCAISPQDAAEIAKAKRAPAIEILERDYLARYTFYVGDEIEAEVREHAPGEAIRPLRRDGSPENDLHPTPEPLADATERLG